MTSDVFKSVAGIMDEVGRDGEARMAGETATPQRRVNLTNWEWCRMSVHASAAVTTYATHHARGGLKPAEIQIMNNWEALCKKLGDAPEVVNVEQHPDDEAVDRFAVAMKAKMKHAREVKGRSGWDDPAQISIDGLVNMMVAHVAKGDMVDLGNFAMMIWNREQAA